MSLGVGQLQLGARQIPLAGTDRVLIKQIFNAIPLASGFVTHGRGLGQPRLGALHGNPVGPGVDAEEPRTGLDLGAFVVSALLKNAVDARADLHFPSTPGAAGRSP